MGEFGEFSRTGLGDWMPATVREMPTYARNLPDQYDDDDYDDESSRYCDLEHCITAIESILGGPAASSLTSEQAYEIGALRRKVSLSRATAGPRYNSFGLPYCSADFRRKFIPSEVMADLKAVSNNDAANKDRRGRVVNTFIASHFGGLVLPSGTPKKAKEEGESVSVGDRRTTKPTAAARAGSTAQYSYVPPEWESLGQESSTRLAGMLSWESLSRWGLDVLEVERLSSSSEKADDGDGGGGGDFCRKKKRQSCPLLLVGWAILGSPHSQREMLASIGDETFSNEAAGMTTTTGGGYGYDFPRRFGVTAKTLCSFLRAIESGYKQDNPYHNSTHAADVLQTTHALLQCGGGEDRSISDLCAPLDLYSTLLAAVVHDVHHPGLSNAFQINARTDVAIRYNDRSVLENMHASRAFQLLVGSSRKAEVDVLKGLSSEEARSARRNIIDAVLSTDMQEHFTAVANMKETLRSFDLTPPGDDDSNDDDDDDNDDQRREKVGEVLRFVLHLADISNSAKPRPLCHRWADRVLEEFFSQGDREKELGLPVSPLCDRETTDRAESQIGFIKFVVRPAFEVLAQVVPRMGDEILPVLNENLLYWEDQKEQSVMASIGEGA